MMKRSASSVPRNLGAAFRLAGVALCASACSAGGNIRDLPDEARGGTSGIDAGNLDDPSGCSERAKLIYTVGDDNTLYAFYPRELRFSPIGRLSCGAGSSTPFSMAVDRQSTAWVLYGDGQLFRVSTEDASCESTSFVTHEQGFTTFGMGFASDFGSATAETLYAASSTGNGLARLDLDTMQLSRIAPYDSLFVAAELTGTGSGRLFGYFNLDPGVVAELDKSTARIITEAPQRSVVVGDAWAFAFWGGDFYLFSAPGSSTRVDRYRPSNGEAMTVLTNTGIRVVGAGVSTCAPVEPPA